MNHKQLVQTKISTEPSISDTKDCPIITSRSCGKINLWNTQDRILEYPRITSVWTEKEIEEPARLDPLRLSELNILKISCIHRQTPHNMRKRYAVYLSKSCSTRTKSVYVCKSCITCAKDKLYTYAKSAQRAQNPYTNVDKIRIHTQKPYTNARNIRKT